jgi:hypothetical protein
MEILRDISIVSDFFIFIFLNKFLLGYIHYTGEIHSDNSD